MTDQPTTDPRSPEAPVPVERRRVPRNDHTRLVRDLEACAGQDFDLVVVGAGIFGAWAAYDAAQRGLSVALIERDDFGGGTSADALRVAHAAPETPWGNFLALRRRAAERCVLMGVAPHLVQPLKMLVPRYGGGRWSLLAMAARTLVRLGATLGVGRRLHDPARRDRRAGATWATRFRRVLPELPRHRLLGAEWWPTLQVTCPERLVLAVVQSAACRGAQVLNHAVVDGLVVEGEVVKGVTVVDAATGHRLSVNARVVLDTTGGDFEGLLSQGEKAITPPGPDLREQLMVQVKRRLVVPGRALRLPGDAENPDLVVASAGESGSILGPWPVPAGAGENDIRRAQAVAACLAAANQGCPAWRLRADDVDYFRVSQVPVFSPSDPAGRVINHAENDGLQGLLSLRGFRYDAAHLAAAEAVDQAVESLGLPAKASRTTLVPLVGGDLPTWRGLSGRMDEVAVGRWGQAVIDGLCGRHGDHAPLLLKQAAEAQDEDPITGTAVLATELAFVFESEAAWTLADAILRRTGVPCWGGFSIDALQAAADVAAARCGWSDSERRQQIRDLRAQLAEQFPSCPPDEPPAPDAAG